MDYPSSHITFICPYPRLTSTQSPVHKPEVAVCHGDRMTPPSSVAPSAKTLIGVFVTKRVCTTIIAARISKTTAIGRCVIRILVRMVDNVWGMRLRSIGVFVKRDLQDEIARYISLKYNFITFHFS